MRDRQIAELEQDVQRKRAQLFRTAAELQDRLNPRNLAREAWEDVKNKGADLAEDAVDSVKEHPLASAGVAAAITAFLARGPLIDAVSTLVGGFGDKRAAKKQRKSEAKKTGKQPSPRTARAQTAPKSKPKPKTQTEKTS